jgi:hypothetical protein
MVGGATANVEGDWVAVPEISEERVRGILPGITFEITSPFTPVYNCAAWAIGEDRKWMQSDAWWPKGVERDETVEALVAAYREFGFEPCGLDDSLDPAFEKLAISSVAGEWKHACKQCPDGQWSSKLGMCEDVKHGLHDVEVNPDYGKIALIMRRPRQI